MLLVIEGSATMRKGSIYKIYCLCTEKIYIGQTVQHPPIRRWVDHYKEAYAGKSNLFLYRAMRQWGIDNFTFQILEENIDLKDLNRKEIEWIKKYNSNNEEYGYNLTRGGTLTSRSKIDEDKVKVIIEDIKTQTEKTFVELAQIHGVSREIISDINCGETWYFVNEKYPIRDNSALKNVLSEKDVYDIYELLKQEVSLTEIARRYKVSVTNISNINQGRIYTFLNKGEYPIYIPNNSKKWLTKQKVSEIIYLLQTTDDIYAEIGNKVGVGRKTVSGINNGVLYKNISKELGINKYPIR